MSGTDKRVLTRLTIDVVVLFSINVHRRIQPHSIIAYLRVALQDLHNDRFGGSNLDLFRGNLAQLSILNMVCTAKDCVHLFKTDVLCLRNEESNVREQYHVDGTEHVRRNPR